MAKNMLPLIEPGSKPAAECHAWDPRYPDVVRSFVAALSPLPRHLSIEHVGSTAIPGCDGKRVIDLIALYEDGFLEEVKGRLLSVGFVRQGTGFSHPWPDDRPMYLGFYRWSGDRFLVYVHVVHQASDEVQRFRTFKARLLQSPDLIAEYCSCKRRIIADGITDTDCYAVRKRAFIHKVLGDDRVLARKEPLPAAQSMTPTVTPPAGNGVREP
jgi:GrpB-like predicted nucleotidyltransferase (UPF0157 family)